jgi:DNA-binding MarR family transcriptional regulator
MSRDRDIRDVVDHDSRPQPAGREMPRGGRSGGATRPRTRPPHDVRAALVQQLDLPRDRDRERVRVGRRKVTLRGSEVRTLALVGAVRIADARVLDSHTGDRWHGDLEHLREAGLITLTPHLLDGQRTALVTLTRDGKALLKEHQRTVQGTPKQRFYAGFVKRREATHDAQLARVYLAAAERLQERGARIRRVVVDFELKCEYQRFLQARNHEAGRSSGRPDRAEEEIHAWADAHGLPLDEGRVLFPDLRIEYEGADGRTYWEDHELCTGHYTTRQMGAKRAAGFHLHHSRASRLRGEGARRGGRPFDPHVAERMLK